MDFWYPFSIGAAVHAVFVHRHRLASWLSDLWDDDLPVRDFASACRPRVRRLEPGEHTRPPFYDYERDAT